MACPKVLTWVLLFLILPQLAFAGDLTNFILKDGSRFQAEILSHTNGVYRLRSETHGEFNLSADKVLASGKETTPNRGTPAAPPKETTPGSGVGAAPSSDFDPKPAKPTKQAKSNTKSEPRIAKPGETYVALGGGGSFPFKATNFKETWSGGEVTSSDLDLKNSLAWGAKAGYFLPNQYSWLGFELDYYERRPDIKQQSAMVTVSSPPSSGQGEMAIDVSYMRTLGFAAVVRACSLDSPIQPYLKAGLAWNFIGVREGRLYDASGNQLGTFLKDESGMAVGPLGAIGINYIIDSHFSAFAETKYTRSTFNLNNFNNAVTDRLDFSDVAVLVGLGYNF